MNIMDDNVNFYELFEQMKLKYNELPGSYNPDAYARSLLDKAIESSEISYAANTTIIGERA